MSPKFLWKKNLYRNKTINTRGELSVFNYTSEQIQCSLNILEPNDQQNKLSDLQSFLDIKTWGSNDVSSESFWKQWETGSQ